MLSLRSRPSGWCSTKASSVGAVARDLDLTESALREWVARAQADRTKGRTGLTTAEREELARLRKENRILQEDGEAVSEKRVRRLMREEQVRGRLPKRFTQTTNSDHADPIAATLLDRDFTAAAPNERWVGDTTEFVIGESAKLYLAAILDRYSRLVGGWAISAVK
jgi:putative transposase